LFARHGAVGVRHGRIVLAAGDPLTGIAWSGKCPTAGHRFHPGPEWGRLVVGFYGRGGMDVDAIGLIEAAE